MTVQSRFQPGGGFVLFTLGPSDLGTQIGVERWVPIGTYRGVHLKAPKA
jgi:hypothetical protein